ncbi:MAG: hypothetical protein N2Z21_01060 [Candidatus Sumerlaeaceae bacterium]|nr:hypothetical protein [Candidatus Sumerlaeaceae bacterium]
MAAKTVQKASAPRRGRKRKETPFRRVLMGIRVEEHVGKLLRALAILQGVPVGEFVEQLLLAAIEGDNALADAKGKIPAPVKKKIEALKEAYDINFSRYQLLSPESQRTLTEEK